MKRTFYSVSSILLLLLGLNGCCQIYSERLSQAIKTNNFEVIDSLIEANPISCQFPKYYSSYSCVVFTEACYAGNMNVIHYLINDKCVFRNINNEDATRIIGGVACSYGIDDDKKIQIMDLFFLHGFTISKSCNSPLSYLSSETIARYLLNKGAHPLDTWNGNPLYSPLCSSVNPRIFRLYIDAVGFHNLRTEELDAIIMKTLNENNPENLSILLERGLKKNYKINNRTLYELASDEVPFEEIYLYRAYDCMPLLK